MIRDDLVVGMLNRLETHGRSFLEKFGGKRFTDASCVAKTRHVKNPRLWCNSVGISGGLEEGDKGAATAIRHWTWTSR